MAASGCFGYGVEYADAVDLSTLGAVVSRAVPQASAKDIRPQRIVETPSGMLNAIGLQGIGVHRYIAEKLPELRRLGATNIINICGSTLDEYVELARILSDAEGVHALELNISCPNIKEGGITFGCSLHGTFDVVSAVKKVTTLPVIPKLTPNVTDVASIRQARRRCRRRCRVAREHVPGHGDRRRDAAAEAVEHRRRPERPGDPADRGAHGLRVPPRGEDSGHRHGRHRHAPRDALEFIIAGATAVQVGTANFVDPFIWTSCIDGMQRLHARGTRSRGSPTWWARIDTSTREKQWVSS